MFLFPSPSSIDNTLSQYVVARIVSFGSFIQRIDAIFILIWIMSIFSSLAIIMHIVLISFKKAVNIKNESSIVYAFSAIVFMISMIPKNIVQIGYFGRVFYKYSSIILVFVITFSILISGYIKKKHELKKEARQIEEAS